MQNSQALISPEASIIQALADPVPTSIPTIFYKDVSNCYQLNDDPPSNSVA